MKHELKTDPIPFQQVVNGYKTFEIRKNDRGFGLSDLLILRETRYTGQAMAAGKPLEYTGNAFAVRVRHIMSGPAYGLAGGWVIMSVIPSAYPIE